MPVVDTSVILRLLTMDDENKAKRFLSYLKVNRVVLVDMVFAEVAWTLSTYYKFPKNNVLSGLRLLITNSQITFDRQLLEQTLSLYERHNIKFIDCYLSASALHTDGQILSYDKDFNRIADLKRVEP